MVNSKLADLNSQLSDSIRLLERQDELLASIIQKNNSATDEVMINMDRLSPNNTRF